MKISSKKLLIWLATGCVVLIILAIVAKKQGWTGQGSATEVLIENAEKRTIVETVAASGKIFPETEVTISPDVSGEIVKLFFEEGDSVSKGDLLVEIQPDIYQSMLDRAEATLNQAKASLANSKARMAQVQAQFDNAQLTYDRNQKLYEKKVLSEAEYQNAVAAFKNAEAELEATKQTIKGAEYSVKSAEATLKEAKDNLTKTRIYAPMSGIISMLAIEQGERVVGTTQMPGTEILTIADLNNMEVKVSVSENDILRVQEGDTATIEVDAYIDRDFQGIVTHIANSAAADKQLLTTEQVTNFEVRIMMLKDSYKDLITARNQVPFKPGMSASVEIRTNRVENVMTVPIQAVTIREGEDPSGNSKEQVDEIVFVYDNGLAKATTIKTGIQDDRYIHIKEGLEDGSSIISGPYSAVSRLLKDGARVEIIEKETEIKP